MKIVVASLIALACVASLSVQAAEVGKEGLLIDLSPHFTTRFDRPNFKGIGKELPSLNPVIDGLRFQLTGQVSLWSEGWASRNKIHPVSVRDLAVNAKFDELHLIHHGNWHEVDGRAVAIVRLNYADGGRHDFPMRWGDHVRSWMYFPSDENLPNGRDPNSKFIWLDPSKNNNRFKEWRMVWKTHLMNPHPDRLVRSMEFHSGRTFGQYSVVSAVVARRDPSRPKTKPLDLGIPPRNFQGRVKINLRSAKTGLPITNATIRTSVRTKGIYVMGDRLVPDRNGQAIFRYWKGETTQVAFHVVAPGYRYGSRTLSDDLASEVTLELTKSPPIGGVVIDEEGKPVPDVTVNVSYSVALTDQDGRWSIDGLDPARLRNVITLMRHRDPARELRLGEDVSAEELAAGKARLVFLPGCELSGVVRDEKGKPVSNARVFFGKTYSERTTPELRTDKEGRFKFANLPRGQSYLTIRKWEHAPEIINVDFKSRNEPLEITTKPGHAILFYVRDANRKPIPGVSVFGYPTSGPRTYRVGLKTKSDGSIFFGGLAKAPMRYTFEKEGFRRHSQTFTPSITKPYEVVLGGKRFLEGRVVDAETGQPLKAFTVIAGQAFAGRNYFYPPRKRFEDGSFKLSLDQIPDGRDAAIRIDAVGYFPHLSKPFAPDATPQNLVVSLKKGKATQGRVLSPAGRPVNNAQVTARAGDRSASLKNGELFYVGLRGNPPPIVRTDAAGRFTLNPERGLADLLVAHETGFAQIPIAEFASDKPIRLQAWGSFRGRVTHAGKAVAQEIVGVDFVSSEFADVSVRMPTNPFRSDADGRVELDHLPPGEYHLVQHIPGKRKGSYNYGHSIPFTVHPGKEAAATLDLEIKFRDIVGRVIARGWPNVDLTKTEMTLRSTVTMKPTPGMSLGPKAFDELQAEQGYVTPEFKLRPRADGSFTVKNVPAGYYRVYGRLPDAVHPQGPPLGRLYDDIRVPPGPGAADIGQFVLLPFVAPNSVPKL